MAGGTIHQHLEAAQHARSAGQRDVARKHLEAVLAIDSEEPSARNLLGVDALERQDAGASADHFEIACRREPDNRGHWINLATARRMLGNAAAEEAALEKALTLDQTDLLALIRLAELYERQGRSAKAADRWRAVIQLSSHIEDPSPEFLAIVERAKNAVREEKRQLATAVADALDAELSEASVRDRRRMQAASDAWLGKRAIYANHCEGLHYPFLPADEFFDREHFTWLEQLEAATAVVIEELKAVLATPDVGLVPYISMPEGMPANKWSELDKSLDWGALHLWKEGERNDAVCARVPRTAALLESLPLPRISGRAPNAFFSILKAGAHIPPHTGVTNVRSVVHLPLIVPAGCAFRVGGETRSWRVGEAFVFDDTIEHEAWNRSNEDRAVLIIDTWNPHLSEHERAMIRRLYEAADRQRLG
ncbi:aspartyl/asparaginyl beta-hydroxylase domain-containing protein [Sphingomonas sp. SM33]|uniref:Aspartyl/asparaginyl beta-hydroxylase domain-containing protein n=1 Tax=Sphingomonas telluris TaxID=2907998 RepID=A0ABS9VQ43_9SPHN|nr:aspartyl/asparaginyl beta-hydroxylase domain-containing protein [Sphingomonas telluris]MCH8617098.1 aspartyl/asparaginyl beta-hydroxylase domain-containing protein [Sphingomonas telluris]